MFCMQEALVSDLALHGPLSTAGSETAPCGPKTNFHTQARLLGPDICTQICRGIYLHLEVLGFSYTELPGDKGT